jgi:hypothetical protein
VNGHPAARPITRWVLLALLAAALVVIDAPSADAQPGPPRPCAPGEPPVMTPSGEMSCYVVTQPTTPVAGPGGGNGGVSPAPWPPEGYVIVEWPSGGSEEDGTPCIERNTALVAEEDRLGWADSYLLAFFRWYERLPYDILGDLQDCSVQPGEPTIDPAAVRALIVSQLPLPAPSIDPGRAITGLRSYLDVGAPTSWGEPLQPAGLPFQLQIDGTAEYRVDWCDGTVETYASSGGPYPDGDITHVYTSVGDHTVTVTPVWTVSWAGGGLDVTFTAELAPSSVDLPVGEVQSVRTD